VDSVQDQETTWTLEEVGRCFVEWRGAQVMRAISASKGTSWGAATRNRSKTKADGKDELYEFIKVLLRAKQGVSMKDFGGYTPVLGSLKLKDIIWKIANDLMKE
jgi:hypothetical protein